MKKFSFIIIAALLTIAGFKASAQVAQQDFEALVALYNATNGANWNDTTGWNLTAGPENVTSSWYGVTVARGRVTQLRLAGNNLDGNIPAQIGNLTGLQFLFLENNSLSGNIPEEIGALENLTYFYAHRNDLTGPIPQSIGSLVNLTLLKLYENELSGEIPAGIGALSQLRVLYLNINQFSGQLPPEMGNLSSLQNLRLFMNNFTGEIPAEFANLTSLTHLLVYRNNFTGLPDLSELNLSELQIYRNNFDFGDIIPYLAGVATFTYSPQYKVGQPQNHQVPEGSSYTISVTVGGNGNTYQWFKGGLPITGANATDYTITDFTQDDVGEYYCEIDNLDVDMTLESETFTLSIGSAQQDPLDISVPPGSTGDLSLGSIPGTGILTVTDDQSGTITNIQFDVDENGNISNVQMETEGQYIPMYQDFFSTSPGQLNIVHIEDVCTYKGN